MKDSNTPFECEIHPLSRQIEVSHFDCGNSPLNEYLQKYARQNHDKNISKTFIAVEKDGDKRGLGYYTAIASEIKAQDLPEQQSKHLPKYPVPVIRIGRLAVDKPYKGKRIGEKLLLDALSRANRTSKEVGIYAVVVDAKDDIAGAFYQKYGFIPLSSNPRTLFLPIKTIKRLFSDK